MRMDVQIGCMAVVLAAGLVGCGESASNRPAADSVERTADKSHADASVAADQPAQPAVEALPVVDYAATRDLIASSVEADQVTVIDFWATWCAPCVEIFGDLHHQLYELGDGVRPVSVTFDAAGDYEAKAIAFLHKHDALKDAYRVDGDGEKQEQMMQLGDRWTNLVVPVILVFDQRGELSAEFHAEDAVADDIVGHVRTLLN